jgi:hypothetical protein
MSLTTRVGLLAGASALTLTGVSFADNPVGGQDYEARIAELEAEVENLKGGDNWLTDQRAEEIRGLVYDVLADADTRSSLLQGGMTSGYDDGFMIGSPDGNFSLKLNGHLQVRYVVNNQDDGSTLMPNTDDTDRRGFEVTRARLIFSGNVGGPEWTYYINGGFDRDTGSFVLQDATISKDMGDGWSASFGQFKMPVNREWLVDSMDQLAVERSVTSYLFSGGRTQGAHLSYTGDQWRFAFSGNDGADAAFGGGPSGWETYDTEYAFATRAEILLSGNWDQFNDLTSPQGSEQGIMIGVGALYQSAEYGTAAGPELEAFLISADVSFETDGWNVFGSISYLDFSNTPAGFSDSSPLGVVVQGGYYFTEKVEGFVRYEYVDLDDLGVPSGSPGLDDLSLVTIGVNMYYNPNVKATVDLGYAFDAVEGEVSDLSAADIAYAGLRDDDAGDDGQWVLRGQLQLTF